jgi:GAF domain-containing protein
MVRLLRWRVIGAGRRVAKPAQRRIVSSLSAKEFAMFRPMDADTSEVLGLRLQLTQAETAVADALFERSAADRRTLWALTLFGAISRLWEAGSLDRLYAALDEMVLAVLGGRRIAIYLREPGSAKLRLLHTNVPDHVPAPSAILGEGTIGRAAAERRTIDGVVPGSSGQLLAVPLGASPEAIGSLVLYAAPEVPALDADELQFIKIVCRHAGNAILVYSDLS